MATDDATTTRRILGWLERKERISLLERETKKKQTEKKKLKGFLKASANDAILD